MTEMVQKGHGRAKNDGTAKGQRRTGQTEKMTGQSQKGQGRAKKDRVELKRTG